MSHRRFENQLRMELVKNTVDWALVLETIPDGSSEEDEEKRRSQESYYSKDLNSDFLSKWQGAVVPHGLG